MLTQTDTSQRHNS